MTSNFKASDKVWIYTSKEPFTESQLTEINAVGNVFLNQWESHGAKVKGSISVKYNQFIVIIADDCDGNMCGRAQDGQVRLIKELEEHLDLTLMDRLNLAYRNHNNEVEVKPMQDFKDAYKLLQITEDSIVFNNMVTDVEGYNSNWEIPLKDSWHKQLV